MLPGGMATPRAEAETVQEEDHRVPESEGASANGADVPKLHSNQLQEAPIGQI